MIIGDGVCDISPCGNDAAEYHEAKREERHASDLTPKPEDFTVGNENNGQVLEDGVNGNGQKLDGPCTSVDHAD